MMMAIIMAQKINFTVKNVRRSMGKSEIKDAIHEA